VTVTEPTASKGRAAAAAAAGACTALVTGQWSLVTSWATADEFEFTVA